jgi:hypothetical protein
MRMPYIRQNGRAENLPTIVTDKKWVSWNFYNSYVSEMRAEDECGIHNIETKILYRLPQSEIEKV